MILGSQVSLRTIGCLAVVITGFIVGVGGEVHLSVLGVQWGLISSVAVSLNSIYTKKVRYGMFGLVFAHGKHCACGPRRSAKLKDTLAVCRWGQLIGVRAQDTRNLCDSMSYISRGGVLLS